MDEIDRRILNGLQGGFPVCERPFLDAATVLGLSEEDLIRRIGALLDAGTLTRFGPLYNADRMGGAFTLAAMSVPEADFGRVAAAVGALAEVAHNYRREHRLNMWFVVAADAPEGIAAAIRRIEEDTGYPVLDFPKQTEYFVELKLAV